MNRTPHYVGVPAWDGVPPQLSPKKLRSLPARPPAGEEKGPCNKWALVHGVATRRGGLSLCRDCERAWCWWDRRWLRGWTEVRYVRCGKPGCHCCSGPGHGPYVYRLWHENGRRHCLYQGRLDGHEVS